MENDYILVEQIQRKAYNLLRDLTNYSEEKGYGLTLDHNEKKDVASIAATGFVLSSYIVAVKYQYLSYLEAEQIVLKTLKTLLYHVPHHEGFFAHFVDIHSAERYRKSEYSTIDTALALNGVIAVSNYFSHPEIKELSEQLITRVNWSFLIHERNQKPCLYMAYNPNSDGDYANGNSGFIHHWSMYAEQLMMYVMIAGSNIDEKLARSLYHGFERVKGSYLGHEYYYTPGNTLFIYQYPLAWLDIEGYYDQDGISWFENAQKAVLGHRAWTLRNMKRYQTFHPKTFGLTASSKPGGYDVFEVLPNVFNKAKSDGTVAPNAMVGSLILQPKLSIEAIKYMRSIKGLWGKYGFKDAYNFEHKKWISTRYITIDKGLELLMANAYLSKDVLTAYTTHPLIKKGMEILKWQK